VKQKSRSSKLKAPLSLADSWMQPKLTIEIKENEGLSFLIKLENGKP
jgi:hypothetical protein